MSGGQLTGLKISLTTLTLLLVLPVLLLLYLISAGFLVLMTALALKAAHGLSQQTYEAAFIGAAIMVVALGVVTVPGRLRTLAGQAEPWYRRAMVRPTFVLGLLAVGCSLVEAKGLNLPDVIPSVLWLATLGTVLMLWPLAFLGYGIRWVRGLFRIGSASSHRAGLMAGAAVMLVFTSGLDVLGTAVSDEPWDGGVIAELGLDQLEWPDEVVADSRDGFKQLHAYGSGPIRRTKRKPPSRPEVQAPAVVEPLSVRRRREIEGRSGDPFSRCIGELYTQPNPPARPAFEEAKRLLIRRWHWAPDVAEDLAKDALIKVCLVDARKPLRDRIPYFIQAAKNRARTAYTRGASGMDTCALKKYEMRRRGERWEAPEPHSALEVALCQLEAPDRAVIELLAEGYQPRDIAEAQKVSQDAARQRVRRARKALGVALESVSVR